MRFFRLQNNGHYAYFYYLKNRAYIFLIKRYFNGYAVNKVEAQSLTSLGTLLKINLLPCASIHPTLKAAKIAALKLVIEHDKTREKN